MYRYYVFVELQIVAINISKLDFLLFLEYKKNIKSIVQHINQRNFLLKKIFKLEIYFT